MSVNRKVYLSINGQAHEGDISIITDQLSKSGFEVVKHSPGSVWNETKIEESNFLIVLPSPILYKKNKSMWIVGKGQWQEIQTAFEQDMAIYVKDIKTGLLYPCEDVFMIEQKKDDWINYAVIDADTNYDLDVEDLFGENYLDSDYYTDFADMNHFTEDIPKDADKCKPAASKYVIQTKDGCRSNGKFHVRNTSVLGRARKARSFE